MQPVNRIYTWTACTEPRPLAVYSSHSGAQGEAQPLGALPVPVGPAHRARAGHPVYAPGRAVLGWLVVAGMLQAPDRLPCTGLHLKHPPSS